MSILTIWLILITTESGTISRDSAVVSSDSIQQVVTNDLTVIISDATQ